MDISQYAHTSWKVRDGFVPGAINDIAQTPDGYLWLGTAYGLFRFDGVHAVPWQRSGDQELSSGSITRLMVSRDGTLWIGTPKGLASWRNGQLTRYAEFSEHRIGALLEDHEGTIWVGEWGLPPGRLCAIRRGAVQCYGTDGSLGWGVLTLFEDSKGNFWVGGGGPPKFGFWRWNPGPPKLYAGELAQSFAETNNGDLLIGTAQGLMRFANGNLKPFRDALPRSMRGLTVDCLRWDREGSLWVGMNGGGVAHLHGRRDVFTTSEGLSGNQVTALFEDREGNIWIATQDGLDRFRNFAASTWSRQQGLPVSPSAGVLATNDGIVWTGVVRGLASLHKDALTIYRRTPEEEISLRNSSVQERIDRALPQHFWALLQDRSKHLWISSDDSLGYLDGQNFHALPHFGARVILSLAEDPSGDLWVLDQENGLFRLKDGRVIQQIPWHTLGHKDYGSSLVVDPLGGLWIGFFGNGIVYVKNGTLRASYSGSKGLDLVRDLRLDTYGTLWASTEGGLSRVKDARIATLTSKNGLPCETVRWSIEDDDQSVWLYMPCGLVRIARSELDAWSNDPGRKVQAVLFDASDGVRGAGDFTRFHPQVSKAPDGRIWFGAPDGLSVIDPQHLAHNKFPPPVHIEQITADGKVYDSSAVATGPLKLSALVRNLDIDYTALSLVVPEKVHFRFKLEGQDKNWREVVNVRQVQYSNLVPKHYRFLVKACNNSGVWNEEGAVLDFVIPPAWYQTNWFRALCVAAFLALLWALYQYRLHQMARQFNMRLEERVSERTRIARDLHDTLLQNFQAVLLPLQAVSFELPEGKTKSKLDRAIDHAAKAITEGRDTVQGLRTSTVESNDLALAIRTLGAELAVTDNGSQRADFTVQLEGVPQNLHPIVRDEVYRVAGEAVRNAFRHANAQRIEVEIRYDEDQLRVRVRDDGKGIDQQQLDGGGRKGHFGLHGMRERAKLLGGNLRLWSKPDAGTEVELTIPARHAYRPSQERRRSWLVEKLRGERTERKP